MAVLGAAAVAAGLGAVIISLAQCVLGLLLAGAVVPGGHARQAGALFEAISRVDGVKMLTLAVMAAAGTALARRSPRLLPRWLGYAGALLAAALAVSGAATCCWTARGGGGLRVAADPLGGRDRRDPGPGRPQPGAGDPGWGQTPPAGTRPVPDSAAGQARRRARTSLPGARPP